MVCVCVREREREREKSLSEDSSGKISEGSKFQANFQTLRRQGQNLRCRLHVEQSTRCKISDMGRKRALP
jgi:hypothetical protein